MSATVGRRSTRRIASARSISDVENGATAAGTWAASRVVRGGLPSRTDSGRSMGVSRPAPLASASVTTSWPSAVAWPEHGVRAALARAQRREGRQALRRDRQHVAFLRFVAPQLQRRQAGLRRRDVAQREARAAPAVVHQLGQRVRQAPGAHVVDREDRVGRSQRGAAVDDLLAAPLHLGVVPLDRREVQVLGRRARCQRRRRAAAQPDQHGRAAQHHQRGAGRDLALLHQVGTNVAEAARHHDRLVIAADLTPAAGDAHLHLEGAKGAGQRGAPELVVEGGARPAEPRS